MLGVHDDSPRGKDLLPTDSTSTKAECYKNVWTHTTKFFTTYSSYQSHTEGQVYDALWKDNTIAAMKNLDAV